MKAKRLWLIIPWAIFLALAIGWVIYWNVLANGARTRLEAWIASEHAKGAQVSIGEIEARGFPVLLRLELAFIEYAPAGGGWRMTTEAGALHLQMLNPQHAIFEAKAPITVARDNGDVTNIRADALIVSVRMSGASLAQAGVEADNLVLDDPQEAGVTAARKLVLNMRPDPRAEGDVQIALDVQGLALAKPVRSFEALGQTVELLRAAVVAEHAAELLEGADGDALAPWRAVGGRLRFEALTLNWGALNTTGEGVVAIDDQRRLTGALAFPIEEPAPLLRTLADGPETNADTRQALTLLSAAFERNDRTLTLDLEAQDGVLRLEGFRVRRLPAVY